MSRFSVTMKTTKKQKKQQQVDECLMRLHRFAIDQQRICCHRWQGLLMIFDEWQRRQRAV
jgi:hypothetical protein